VIHDNLVPESIISRYKRKIARRLGYDTRSYAYKNLVPSRAACLLSKLRIALFTDSLQETNGVGTLCREYLAYARERDLPFLCAYGGPTTVFAQSNTVSELQLRRSALAFHVDSDVRCDPLLSRFLTQAVARLRDFRPDLVHVTGPGDVSLLGVWAANLMGIPTMATWHTDVHEYAHRRVHACLRFLPRCIADSCANGASRSTLWTVLQFYQLSHFLAAPNQAMADSLIEWTTRPSYLMQHGTNTALFAPSRRTHHEQPFTIGYVGRLSPEKNVRALVEIERQLFDAGESNFRFSVIGDGCERAWLQANLRTGDFTGILRDTDLATAFANMDAFVFPSATDTFGLVILEAMSSGVPVIVRPEAGVKAGVVDGVDGFHSTDFTAHVRRLMHCPETRAEMGRSARMHACATAWPGVFDDIQRIYREGLEHEQTRRRMPTPKYDRAPCLATLWH
jgi:phosphatidylinositol alpha 1,6-mannosyltransferase